ncbi:MAG: hypothetical protein NT02SARS_1599 [SAR86 cluster bacterium SAR86B]|uniref:Uncharacterized protein n=1 Tax=SAR86 cluster bacterium SAR86B TaxID=1123867 RepID=J4V3Q3_9GAMM|nr:MAG: hypothetical protein NT02SARS_1599 [SAR86 cluster bacterium SAR86B]
MCSRSESGQYTICNNTETDEKCTLNEWGRGMPRCRYVGFCPTGYKNIGDGSACSDGPNRCALYGNAGIKRCNTLSTNSIEEEIDSLNKEMTQIAKEMHDKSSILRNKDEALNASFIETRNQLLQNIDVLNEERNKLLEKQNSITTLTRSLDDSKLQLSSNNLKYVTLGLGAVGLLAYTIYYLRK